MTTEQNQPQAQPPQGQAPQGQSQGQPQGHRRRRRRRKGGKGQPNSPQMNGQASQQNQPQGQKQKFPNQNRQFHKNGNGQGGGRRKNKQRRQQVFVGPMDHSYRAANGNVADGPPSTIEYRNGNAHPNGFNPEAVVEAPPAPVREDAPTRIFCFIDDLFFLAKIQETARKLGIKVGFVKADKDIVSRLADVPEESRPSLIVFDLNNANAKPLTLIPKLKTKFKKGTSIIGFLSHLQGDLKVKALEAGCDMVMPRSAFSQNLPNLLRRHGLDEEMEALEA
ncbi:response regulator [Alloacidobacterium sp.]|uniref:response regulator n=1 Tax=Alloacidobacterium sp. TaxID=2951999 RepID=UPI002D5F86A1|nr:response regulator [Alloacidobacterium sp.]HYK37154.1 response regulator [Alloacidobacterium sp.]